MWSCTWCCVVKTTRVSKLNEANQLTCYYNMKTALTRLCSCVDSLTHSAVAPPPLCAAVITLLQLIISNVALVTPLETDSLKVAVQFDLKTFHVLRLHLYFCAKFNTEALSRVWIPPPPPPLKTVLVPLLSRLNFHKLGCPPPPS